MSWQETTIRICYAGQRSAEVLGYTNEAIPGLAVTRSQAPRNIVRGKPMYVVTHIASGCRINPKSDMRPYHTTLEKAQIFMADIGVLADWTRSAEALTAQFAAEPAKSEQLLNAFRQAVRA